MLVKQARFLKILQLSSFLFSLQVIYTLQQMHVTVKCCNRSDMTHFLHLSINYTLHPTASNQIK